ncbi:MAG: flagellin [Dehalococcoidales bacterium]|nr:flagellin [Dehalococcoidales bacterium]
MYQKLVKAIKRLHVGQRGMTGLETAIILIAFVTVASVLAYSVLSAGIFSAEKGKETVYSGLESAQSSLEVKGAVIGYSSDNSELTSLRVKLGMAIQDEKIDKTAIYLTYFDASYSEQLTTSDFTLTKLTGSTERGSTNMIEGDEVWLLTVTIPSSATVNAYDWCAIQIVPPTGASLQVQRTMPGYLDDYFSLN